MKKAKKAKAVDSQAKLEKELKVLEKQIASLQDKWNKATARKAELEAKIAALVSVPVAPVPVV